MTSGTLMYSLGLIGYPLEHSLSPRLHGAALYAMGLSGEYQLYPVPPLPEGEQALVGLLAQVRRDELSGLNVTIPHKQNVMAHLDELSLAARAIGAVNTIWMQNGRLRGDNTDAPGFMADVNRIAHGVWRMESLQPGSALILGAGGSALAVVYALLEAGWQVTVAARRLEQARALAISFQHSAVSGQSSVVGRRITTIHLDRSSIEGLLSEITLVVNATPVGMWPQVEADPWPEDLPMPEGALVYDLVYNPPETALVRAARRSGLAATTGLGMLVEQAALALELWTGYTVPRRSMWEAAPEFWDRLSQEIEEEER